MFYKIFLISKYSAEKAAVFKLIFHCSCSWVYHLPMKTDSSTNHGTTSLSSSSSNGIHEILSWRHLEWFCGKSWQKDYWCEMWNEGWYDLFIEDNNFESRLIYCVLILAEARWFGVKHKRFGYRQKGSTLACQFWRIHSPLETQGWSLNFFIWWSKWY